MSKPIKFVPYFNQSLNYWTVHIPPSLSKTGKRARLYFKDKEAAIRASHRLKERHKKFGVSLASLDPPRLAEASEAYNASSFLTFVRRLINTGSTAIFYFRCSHTLA